jgi:hypothetical protein
LSEAFPCRHGFFQLIEEQARVLEGYLKQFGHPPSPLDGDLTKANWTEVLKGYINSAERFDAEFFRHEYQAFDAQLQSAVSTFLLGDYYDLSSGRGLGNGERYFVIACVVLFTVVRLIGWRLFGGRARF